MWEWHTTSVALWRWRSPPQACQAICAVNSSQCGVLYGKGFRGCTTPRRSRSRPELYARSPRRGSHRYLRIDSASPNQKSHTTVVQKWASSFLAVSNAPRTRPVVGRAGCSGPRARPAAPHSPDEGTTWKGLRHNYNLSGHWLEGCVCVLPLRLSHVSIRRSALLRCHDSTSSHLAITPSKWHMQGSIAEQTPALVVEDLLTVQ